MEQLPYKEGQQVSFFTIERVVPLPELKSCLIEARHNQSHARVMHIACDDDENLFCLSFKTYPNKSDGVAHILEHTVLCGSEKYPVRDPFFSMNRRSLNTFMNALTGPDFTCYPAASAVEADFYNLLSVYLDAVFHPLLTEESFWQEGHRLELDEKGHLHRKGIVFNEMKGAMATPESRLNEETMALIFPDLTYKVNSGGDPKVIPELTYEELQAFHQAYYHPSRALFFFYGNIPIEKHLNFIEENLLKEVSPLEEIPPIPKQPRFKSPIRQQKPYPISKHEDQRKKTFVTLSWLTCSILEQKTLLALFVLELALMGTDAAPLKMALLKSGLCQGAESAIDNELSEAPFTLVLKGCEKGKSAQIEAFVLNELTTIAQKGLALHLIDGALHQLEMARSEIGGGSAPFGLSLFLRAALIEQHGGKGEEALLIHSLFDSLREDLKDPSYFSKLIEDLLLKNPHFVVLELYPDKTLAQQEETDEKEALHQLEAKLSSTDRDALLTKQKRWETYQEEGKHQDLEVLPKVSLNDVPKHTKHFPLNQTAEKNLTLFSHPCFTNGLIYADVVYDLPALSAEELQDLRLFATLLPQMGAGTRTYKERLDAILEHTGGIDLSLDLGIQINDPKLLRPSLAVRGKALARKASHFFSLLKETLLAPNFDDVSRLKELLMQHHHSVQQSVNKGSLRYAINLGLSALSSSAYLSNLWYGLPYYWHLTTLKKRFEKNPDTLIERLKHLQEKCLGLKGPNLVLSCDEETTETLKKEAFYGLLDLPQKAFTPWDNALTPPPITSQGRITSSPVAFTFMGYRSIPYPDPRSAALALASEIMENTLLHPQIREVGGAYGAGAVQGLLSGHFYFYSHRDPHLAPTLNAFTDAIDKVAQGDFAPRDLEEAKLGLIQQLDDPTPPGERAEVAFYRGRTGQTLAFRQAFRERLLAQTPQDVKKSVEEVLLPQKAEGIVVSFAGQPFFDKENSQLQAPLPLYSLDPQEAP